MLAASAMGLAIVAVAGGAVPGRPLPYASAGAARWRGARLQHPQQDLLAARSVPWLDVPLLALGDTFLDIARSSTLNSPVTITKYEDLFEMSPSSRAALFEAARVTLERAVSSTRAIRTRMLPWHDTG